MRAGIVAIAAVIALSAFGALFAAAPAGNASVASSPSSLFAPAGCTVAIYHETAHNNALQTAITAFGPLSTPASPVTICLGPTTFPEQLTINGTQNLTIVGSSNSTTLIAPSSLSGNGVDLDHALPAYAIIGAWNDANLTLSNLGISGSSAAASLSGCTPQFFGIYLGNSSAVVNGSTVSGVNSNGGCQGQNAIVASNGWFQTHVAQSQSISVVGTTVSGYGKDGIVCKGLGVSCTISENTVSTTAMSLGFAATNGIELYDAAGSIVSNTVSGNVYLPGSCLEQNYFNSGASCVSGAWASGILFLSAPSTVLVAHNTLLDNQVGIWSITSPTNASDNTIGAWGYYGIALDYSPGSLAYYPAETASPYTGTVGANSISDQNVGVLAYDDNTSVVGNSLSSVNVSIEVATDSPAASVDTVSNNVGSSNVSGALLGNVSSFQLGDVSTPTGTYTVDGNQFTNVSGASSTALGTGIAINGAAASLGDNTLANFPSGITAVVPATGNVTATGNTITSPAPAIPGNGLYVFAGNASLTENSVSNYSWLNGPGWWPNSQAPGLFAQCLNRCDAENNTLTNDAIGAAFSSYMYGPFPAPSWPFAAPPSNGPFLVKNNSVTDSGAFGIAFELNQGTNTATSAPVVQVQDNTVDNTLSGAVGLMADQGTYYITGNTFDGTTATGSSGAGQPTGAGTIATASIQVLDAYDSVTRAFVGGNSFGGTTLYTSLLNLTSAPPYYAAIYGDPALGAPSTPTVSATALDSDQALTVASSIPNSGVPAYTWSWLVSVNDGAYAATSLCAVSGGSGAVGGAPESCAIAANSLVIGDNYTFELSVTDSATAPVTQASAPSALVSVSSALTTPATPSVSATTLDADQTLVVSSAVPTSGSSPYSWEFLSSVNGGSYSPVPGCDGFGASPGSPAVCTFGGGTLTVGDTYAFELSVTDGASSAESATSGASPIVTVHSALAAPGTPSVSATALDRNQPLTVHGTLPTSGTGPYLWAWLVSINGGAFAASTACTTNSGVASGGASVTCSVASNTLIAGDSYQFELSVTDNATAPEHQSSSSSATVSVSSSLLRPGRPSVNRPALDVDQVVTIRDKLPNSGTAPYSWSWLVSVNSGAYLATTQCTANSGTGPASAIVTCVIPAHTLVVGDYYDFELRVTDNASHAESSTSLATLQTLTVSSALTAPAAPTPSATNLDVDQVLTVTGTIPTTGTAPYSWTWQIWINTGSYATTTQCATNSGTGASAGATVHCTIAASSLTVGDRYAFRLQVSDGASSHERFTSAASSVVHVRSALTPASTPTVSFTRIAVNQSLAVRSTVPTTGTPHYSYAWLVSVNGGAFGSASQCTTNSGTASGGATITCTIPGNTLTSTYTYAFELQVTDSASSPETQTSGASPTVTVA